MKLNTGQRLAREYEIESMNSPKPSSAAVAVVAELVKSVPKPKGKRGRPPGPRKLVMPDSQNEKETPVAKRLRSRQQQNKK
jgi:hypothetical protein